MLDNDGDIEYVQGSGAKPYELKNIGGTLSCSCPAWRNQSKTIDKRTCKHLKKLRGAAVEEARVSGGAPPPPAPAPVAIPTPVLTVEDHRDRVLGLPPPAEKLDGMNVALAGVTMDGDVIARTSGRRLFGCACEQGRLCDVNHDPEACLCPLCSQIGVTREQHTAMMEGALGRKLRQDEKAKLYGPPVLLAHKYEDHQVDPTGWLWSEKLDGVRAYWDGKRFVTRQGNVYDAPGWFTDGLPDFPLDGELWLGRQKFQETISIVKSGPSERWRKVTYCVFDHPTLRERLKHRIAALIQLRAEGKLSLFSKVVQQDVLHGKAHMENEVKRVVAAGGEGIMIRDPESFYETRRSVTILKVKLFVDAEATVIGYKPGKGRLKGMTGALRVRMPDGKEFDVGSGMEDADRRDPPPVGAVITFKYTETTNAGIPKCASYVGPRDYE